MKKKYAICGLSNRAISLYAIPLIGIKELEQYGDFTQYGEIAAILDIDRERMQAFLREAEVDFPLYTPEEFDKMITETKPDYIVVTGADHSHAEYIIKAFEHNIDVISEKPLVANCEQANRLLEAQTKSTANLRVTHNMRYDPMNITLKKLIAQGEIGQITNVEMTYNLDTYHGASYFKRWNRYRDLSGGLSITKECHHFDLLNWLINDVPEKVFAFGKLNYFGPKGFYNPQKESNRKLSVEEQKEKCPYFQHWNKSGSEAPQDDHLVMYNKLFNIPMNQQYPQDEELYIYDDDINIEDTYSVVIKYAKGASVAYSANFSTPWEGYILGINGSKGRIEAKHYSAPSRCAFIPENNDTIKIIPLFGEAKTIEVPKGKGSHNGSDARIKEDIFIGSSAETAELSLCAGLKEGAQAVAIGEAVWKSCERGSAIELSELLVPQILK